MARVGEHTHCGRSVGGQALQANLTFLRRARLSYPNHQKPRIAAFGHEIYDFARLKMECHAANPRATMTDVNEVSRLGSFLQVRCRGILVAVMDFRAGGLRV